MSNQYINEEGDSETQTENRLQKRCSNQGVPVGKDCQAGHRTLYQRQTKHDILTPLQNRKRAGELSSLIKENILVVFLIETKSNKKMVSRNL